MTPRPAAVAFAEKHNTKVQETKAGHNSAAPSDRLKSFVERVEKLEEEKRDLADDIKSVYLEAKSNGFDVPALRAIVKLRKQDAEKRRAHEAMVDTYRAALGLID